MKTVTDTLGVARSNVAERLAGERCPRGPQTREDDLALAAHIRRLVDARPTYGYRRIGALLNRERRAAELQPVNPERVYRLMSKHGLLLARHFGRRRRRRRPHRHDGKVATLRSNIRWCSDGLKFTCWNGEVVRVNPIPDAGTALAAIEGWMNDYNEVHPHSRLGFRSPREYIRASVQPAACPV